MKDITYRISQYTKEMQSSHVDEVLKRAFKVSYRMSQGCFVKIVLELLAVIKK